MSEETKETKTSSQNSTKENFSLELEVEDDDVRALLEQHLELQRYRHLPGLRRAELMRLMQTADGDIRRLLATLGYFSPSIELELHTESRTTTAPAEQARDAAPPPRVRINVETGQRALVRSAELEVLSSDEEGGKWQRQSVVRSWSLPAGEPFTQEAWGRAKKEGLDRLRGQRYPQARISSSSAQVDADLLQADLKVVYETGDLYRFGRLRFESTSADQNVRNDQKSGKGRYDEEAMRRIARLPSGEIYRQDRLLEAQQRLASSGFYDSVFLTLDFETSDVVAQVREAPLQKWEYGIGVSTDTGARLSLEHTHNRLPWLGWQAHTRLQVERNSPLVSTRLYDLPNERGWRRFVSLLGQQQELADYDVKSAAFSVGRDKTGEKIDRQYFLRYDLASAKPRGSSSSALSINYGWTGRYFNRPSAPTRGHGLALDAGLGVTLTPQRTPFLRLAGRSLYLHPFGERDEITKRRSRLALRLQAGALVASKEAQMPMTLLFLSGGDTTVRGYSYQSIGTPSPDGRLMGGRYALSSSVEWQRPIVLSGDTKNWEQTLFIDAGTVSPRWNFTGEKLHVGVGAGVRWSSPVGPLQADLAYGLQSRKMRLHLRLGFNF